MLYGESLGGGLPFNTFPVGLWWQETIFPLVFLSVKLDIPAIYKYGDD